MKTAVPSDHAKRLIDAIGYYSKQSLIAKSSFDSRARIAIDLEYERQQLFALHYIAKLEAVVVGAKKSLPGGFSCVRILSHLKADCTEAGFENKCPQCTIMDALDAFNEGELP